LAAFEEKKEAEDYTIEIKAAGFPLIILNPLATDKKPWYRVRIGGYATKEDAEQAVARLKSVVNKRKLDYWITRD
jgi:cell division protein FtsN